MATAASLSDGRVPSFLGRVVGMLWEKSWTTASAIIQPQLGFALDLPLPATGEPSQMDRTGSGVQWQLNVVVTSQGLTEEPVFDLPVRS